MEIIYLTVSYRENGGSLYNDLMNALNQKGHKVTIVVPEKLESESYLEIISDYRSILHVKTGDWFSKNYLKKGINMLGFSSKMIKAVKKYLSNEQFDLVLYATPPITFNKVILFCKEKYNCKSFLMLKDIFPQGAIDLGLLSRKNPITKYLFSLEETLYDMSDKIGCMSKKNQEYIIRKNNIKVSKTLLFPNSIKIRKYNKKESDKNYTLFLFGGNLGIPQNVGFILEIIERLKKYDKARFIIVGKGRDENKVRDYNKYSDNSNFVFYDFLDKKTYDNLLATADIGLISLDSRFTIPNIPSKLQNYMNMKIPVLAITDSFTDLKNIISESDCGWWCCSNNSDNVVNCIKEICENKASQFKKGENGFNYLLKNFNIEENIIILEKFVEQDIFEFPK